LQQAIARLGIVTISEITLATSLNSDLFEAPGYEKLVRTLWRKSLLCSAWSKQIARMRRGNVEASFLAGLLCQMGRPVVIQALADFEMDEPQLLEMVDDYYVRAGALLAAIWQLPGLISEVIIHHPHEDPRNSAREVTLNVQAAIVISEQGVEGLSAKMLTDLNFYPEDIATLIDHAGPVEEWVSTLGG
jgi:HD-like signal output (HDOD) protein